jgi:chromosome segregation ATPase
VNQDLSSTRSELLKARSALETKVADLNIVVVQLEQARGELGSRTSENQIMKQDLQTAKRQLESMQRQLERTKLELRSTHVDDYWGDATSP